MYIDAKKVGNVSDIDFAVLKGVVNSIVVKASFTKKYVVGDKIDKIGGKVILRVEAYDPSDYGVNRHMCYNYPT